MDIWQRYQTTHPGEVQVIGVDVFNGSLALLRQFGNSIGATFPLLLNGNSSVGGNVLTGYGDRDVWVVINKAGILRYNAYILYSYSFRYHLDEIYANVDSLVSPPTAVGEAPQRLALRIAPNPFREDAVIELSNPGPGAKPARVTVHDLQGRRVATLWESDAPAGITRIAWDGRTPNGVVVSPGVYVLRGEVGGVSMSRRMTRLQ